MALKKIDSAFKNDSIARDVAYMIATSHEYKEPNEDSAIKLVSNYKWEKRTMNINALQGINKPVIKEKVLDLAKSINPKKLKPLMVVDKFQGITPESKGKKILLDGHHRKEACEFIGMKEVPVYYGKYTGKAEKSVEELILEKKASINPLTLAGAGALALGAGKIGNEFKKGNLTGRETVYHNTNRRNVKGIKEKGILATKSTDKDNLTHKGLSDILSEDEMAGLTYVARKKLPALGIGLTSATYDATNKESKNYKDLLGALSDRKTLKANIPSWKMNIVDNPELQGAKNSKEFRPKLKHRMKRSGPQGTISSTLYNPISTLGSMMYSGIMYDSLGRKGTHTIKGDVGSEYIKGSKNYKPISKEEIKEYISNNPDRFKNGLIDAGIGLGTMTGGAIALAKGLKKKADEDINSIEKQAGIPSSVAKGALGAALLAGSTNAILGKKTLYHGTSKENWDRIKEEGMKADKGGSGASKSVGNNAYQKNSENKVHLTGIKPIANMYSSVNTPEIKKKREELESLKNKALNIQVHQGAPGKSVVDYKLKKGRQKVYRELVKYKEDELKRMNMAQKTFKNVFVNPSIDTDGKTVKVKLDYNKWKNNMEQDREGVALKKQVNKYLKGNYNPVVKQMAARGNIDVLPEEIVGSNATLSDKAKHTLSQLPSYIKENPLRFGAGLTSAGAGTALMVNALRGK